MTDNVTILDKLFFTECMYISSNLCMQLGLPSLDHVFISSFLLCCVVKAALDGCPTSETATVLWHCDPNKASLSTTDQVQLLTRHTLPFRSASVPWLLLESESLVCNTALFLILTLGGTRVGERKIGRSCSRALPPNAATATGRELCCSCRANSVHTLTENKRPTCICFTYRWLKSDSFLMILCTTCNYL